MTPTSTGYEHLPLDDAARVDEACDRFEQAWKAARAEGEPPRIATYLEGVAGVGRAVLVRELIELDQDCRKRYGLPIRPEEYAGLDPSAGAAAETIDLRPGGEGRRGPPAGAPDLPGLQFLEVLGSGGMGVVWKARQAALGRDVAVKLLRDVYLDDAEHRERFHQEARALARLRHPHLIQIHDFGAIPGAQGTTAQPYLVLEYVPGGSLADHLRGEPQPPAEAAGLVETLARAIQHAHEQGIIHRDLKPANVMLAEGNRQGAKDAKDAKDAKEEGSNSSSGLGALAVQPLLPKVTDFGLARLDAGQHLTQTGHVLGTPSYMAPEQVAGRSTVVSAATDVYGLGAILYECLTGRPPFKAETAVATQYQVRHDDPVPPRRLQPTVPRALETICLKCLRKEPGQRYATAGALAEDLRCFLEGKPIAARPISAPGRLLLWARRQPAAAALAALLAVTFLGGVAGVLAALLVAVRARDDARETLDRHRVMRAYDEWLADNVQAARSLLDEAAARRETWEYRYVDRLCNLGLFTFYEHRVAVTGLAFSPGGQHLLSAGRDGAVFLRDLATGKSERLAVISSNSPVVVGSALSPDGRHLAVMDANRFLHVWDLHDRKSLASWQAQEDRSPWPATVTYSPDGRFLATA